MRGKLGASLALVAALAAAPAARADMPDYDVRAWCTMVAGGPGSMSEMIFGSCFRREQEAYDRLKPEWDGLSAQVRVWCNQVAGGSFSILDSCVRRETAAARTNEGLQLRR